MEPIPIAVIEEPEAGSEAILARLRAGAAAEGLRVDRLPRGTAPGEVACVVVALGAIDSGLERVRELRQGGYKGGIVCHGRAPEARLVRAAMSVGADDVIDVEDRAEVAARTVARAAMRREARRMANEGRAERQRWVQDRLAEAQHIAGVGSWEADVATWTAEWSPEMRRIIGLGADDHVPGLEGYVERVHPDDRERVQRQLAALFRSGTPFQLEHRVLRPDGQVVTVHARARGEHDEGGVVRHVFGTVQDVTTMRSLEHRLSRTASLYHSLAENLPNGFAVVFEHDLRVRRIDGGTLASLGLLPERIVGEPVQQMLPAERATLEPLYRRALAGERAQLELKVNGRSFQVTITPATDEDGAVHAGIALYYDITPLVATEAALRRQTGLAMIHGGIAVAANDARTVEEALPTCINLICVHGDWSLGHAWVPSPDGPGALAPTGTWNTGAGRELRAFRDATTAAAPGQIGALRKALADQQPLWLEHLDREPLFARGEVARRVGLQSGFLYPIASRGYVGAVLEFYSTTPRPRDDGLLLTMDIVAVQLGRLIDRERDRRRLLDETAALHSLSIVDELTGLHNRRGFMQRGGRLLADANAEGRRVSLLYVDLDGMKQINDQLGHEVGDRALVETATVLRRCFRDSDVLARLGGDEFVVLAGEKGAVDPQVFAARIQDQVAAENGAPGRAYQLQLSVGIEVSQPDRGEALDGLLQRADQRMYAMKRARKAARGA